MFVGEGKTESRIPIRLLLIGPLPIEGDVLGGAKVSFSKLVHDFSASEDFDVKVVCTSRPLAKRRAAIRAVINLWAIVRVIGQMAVNVTRCDLVMFNVSSGGGMRLGPAVWGISKLCRRPLVVRVFGGALSEAYDADYGVFRWLARKTWLKSERLLLQTRALCDRFKGCPGLRWLPTSRDVPRTFRPRNAVCRRFLFLGHVRRAKGVLEALSASEELPEGCSLAFYGSLTPEVDVSLFDRYANASYCGRVEPEEVHAVLQEHDALVFPTYYEAEGVPGAIVEAMQSGLPVVASNWKAIPEVVGDGVGGMLVEPRDRESLAIAMGRLAQDAELYQQLSQGARRQGEGFRSEHWQVKIEGWCREVCEAPEPRSSIEIAS